VLIQCLKTIVALGFPVLMGPSRKSFIRNLLHLNRDTDDPDSAEQIETGTLAAVGTCLAHGAHILRVHDVHRAVAFTRIFDAVRNA
jgi:dihydropteroate synthase